MGRLTKKEIELELMRFKDPYSIKLPVVVLQEDEDGTFYSVNRVGYSIVLSRNDVGIAYFRDDESMRSIAYAIHAFLGQCGK